MKSKIGFSIVIPCYSVGKYISEVVNSIVQQPFKYPYEIIVVDDCSSDLETQESLDKIEKIDQVKLIKLVENSGVQVARNTAVRGSKFKFVFCIDADDLLNTDPVFLSEGTYPDKAIDILINNSDVAFVHCPSLMFGDFSGLTISAYPVTQELILKKHHAQISIVYRKEDAISAGLYDEAIRKWQDWSFAISLLNYRFKSGKKNEIAFIDRPYHLYRIHNNPDRLSFANVDEKEMIKITFEHNPEIFKNYYRNLNNDEIIEEVFKNKPDKLKDLLYIASYNLDRSISMSEKRGFIITGKNEPPNIP
ncbi:hypothetical protein COU54_00890 [Candidatus Pacearchaeota archaeon CG10_big_fil_rev_8_21_14_0_10_31_24]|nr:MAG: hypothetical protein COU54_00890 [Candidatus Pacearchaeota archaeon CG10_big_fil_rev_8_21_14_0_10_31_24]